MIFVTVGSNQEFKFDRLMAGIEQLPPEELVVQYGPAVPPRGVKEAHEWLTFDQVLDYMNEADTVISHAGTGTIICASNMGHVPVVVPRLKRYGETVDDHQVALASMFERTRHVSVAWDMASLPDCVARTSRRDSPVKNGNGKLQAAVHAALREFK